MGLSISLYLNDVECFSKNITHNLGEMAKKALLYDYIWRPDDLGITKAKDLIRPLEIGLKHLLAEAEYFHQFDPPNKWGCYENLVNFVDCYLRACRDNPDADIFCSR